MQWNMSGLLFCLGLFLPVHCLGDDRQVASRPLGIVQQLDQHGQLWSDDISSPRLETISFPDGIRHVRVEQSTGDKFTFLHDPVIAWHQNSLFAAWYEPGPKVGGFDSVLPYLKSRSYVTRFNFLMKQPGDRVGEGLLVKR